MTKALTGADFLAELKVIRALAKGVKKGIGHQAALSAFYGPQANHYDHFREKLLYGRKELFERIVPDGFKGIWVDIGGGTARNIEFVHHKTGPGSVVLVIDLCEPLLRKAKERIKKNGWTNVETIYDDAVTLQLNSLNSKVDLVTFSYSLTMIPGWRAALSNAFRLLRVGGKIGVVDFYTESRDGCRRELTSFERTFWPMWFRRDAVNLNADHLELLRDSYNCLESSVGRGRVPYFFGLKAPYFRFIGEKILGG